MVVAGWPLHVHSQQSFNTLHDAVRQLVNMVKSVVYSMLIGR
jgi:hypothetical protein